MGERRYIVQEVFASACAEARAAALEKLMAEYVRIRERQPAQAADGIPAPAGPNAP